MMKMKHLLLLLALGGFGASCSNDDLTDGSTNPIEGRTELQIAFSGSGEGQEYTRAIASEGENKIDQLAVYLFAAASQGGPYYYLETWNEGTAFNPIAPSTDFQKQASGTGWKATIFPGELKGLPWIKLMCVANNGVPVGGTTDGLFYKEDGTTEALTPLTEVAVDANGNITNTGAATKEEDFRKAYTAALGTDAATGIIKTPLVMTGEGTTKISGSVSKVDISLKRAMARFDIENNSKTSSLTIEEVSLAHGRKTAHLWGAEMSAVAQADLATSQFLATYQPVKFSDMPGANDGMLESAYYVYPGLATDESYLIIKGKYKSPVNATQVEVTYNVPIVRTPEGAPAGTPGEYIPLKANSRYKLRITDVSQSNVFGSFEVVDWTSGGGIIIRPDNDAPVFDATKAFGDPIDPNAPTALTGATVLPNAFEVKGETGTFNITVAATGKVRAEKEGVTVRSLNGDWLSIAPTTTEERDGVWYTTFKVDYIGAIGQQPIAVHFINETASYDPALWTTLNFYGPKAVPGFAVVATGGASKGNTTAVNTNVPTASLYNLKGSFVKFDITCLEGVVIDASGAAGYTATEEKVTGMVRTYKIAVSDAATASDGTIVFKNAGDDTKTTTLTLTSLDPAMTAKEVTDADDVGSGIESGILKIDLDALISYTFKVKAPQTLTAPTNLADCPWLTIDETTAWNSTDGFAVYTITPKIPLGNTADFKLKFINALTETGITASDLEITLHKDFSKPKFAAGTTTASWSDFNKDFALTATAATIEMYNVIGSKVTVNMTCAEAASFEAVDGLSVTKVGATDEYTVEVTDVTKLTDATTVLTVNNDNDAERKATLTITWKSAAITFELGTDSNSAATISGDDINVNYTTISEAANKYVPISINVGAYKGSTISYSGNTSTWLVNSAPPTEITAAGTATIEFIQNGATVSATDDIIITITNAITGGGNKTITLKKQ